MAAVINLTQRDTFPYIYLQLTNKSTGLPINLSDSATMTQMYFRKHGSTTVLDTINLDKVTDGLDGKVSLSFANMELDIPAGQYEGQIFVTFGGDMQTVYETLNFNVRDSFEQGA
jgi:hypothetical protein